MPDKWCYRPKLIQPAHNAKLGDRSLGSNTEFLYGVKTKDKAAAKIRRDEIKHSFAQYYVVNQGR